jgi:hypothetical protein
MTTDETVVNAIWKSETGLSYKEGNQRHLKNGKFDCKLKMY